MVFYICFWRNQQTLLHTWNPFIDFDYMLSGHSAKFDKKSELDNYIEVAEHPDWQNGKLRKNDMLSGNKVVKVVRSSVNPKNKAKIVIEEGRLGEK